MTRYAALAISIVLAGCEPAAEESTSEPPPSGASATPNTAAAPSPSPRPGARYGSLENCRFVREDREEMPYTETLCAGPDGWHLRIADSDARQTLAVVAPDGRETPIDLVSVSAGAFSNFGTTAEWRGAEAAAFTPASLIIRYVVAREPHPAPPTRYLLAIRLVPAPCLVAAIPPGPDQNERARIAADAGAECPAP